MTVQSRRGPISTATRTIYTDERAIRRSGYAYGAHDGIGARRFFSVASHRRVESSGPGRRHPPQVYGGGKCARPLSVRRGHSFRPDVASVPVSRPLPREPSRLGPRRRRRGSDVRWLRVWPEWLVVRVYTCDPIGFAMDIFKVLRIKPTKSRDGAPRQRHGVKTRRRFFHGDDVGFQPLLSRWNQWIKPILFFFFFFY